MADRCRRSRRHCHRRIRSRRSTRSTRAGPDDPRAHLVCALAWRAARRRLGDRRAPSWREPVDETSCPRVRRAGAGTGL